MLSIFIEDLICKILLQSSHQVGIIRQFPFSSSLQRMSVIVRALNKTSFDIFCKGSPEKIAELSIPKTCKNFHYDY
jgi:magnesium-transporting ATPase (P-type)